MTTLSDLYDADQRRVDPDVRHLAGRVVVPHPLTGAIYAEGTYDPHYETPDGIRDEDHRCAPTCLIGVRQRRQAHAN